MGLVLTRESGGRAPTRRYPNRDHPTVGALDSAGRQGAPDRRPLSLTRLDPGAENHRFVNRSRTQVLNLDRARDAPDRRIAANWPVLRFINRRDRRADRMAVDQGS